MATTNEYTEYYDDLLEWLDDSSRSYDAWRVVEEAAAMQSMLVEGYDFGNIKGLVSGMAGALQIMYDRANGETGYYYEGNAKLWEAFIADFAADNYKDGERITF